MAPRVGVVKTPVQPDLGTEAPEDQLDLSLAVPGGSYQLKTLKIELVWTNIIFLIVLHVGALYGMYLIPQAKLSTSILAIALYWLSGLGITAGAHRLWAHRSYKAKLPFRILLAILNSMAYQNDIIEWARDHRVHHKYSETDADPHNAKRGFFFSHIGWIFTRKHPDVKLKGKQLDISDLLNDPVCRIQRKFYLPSVLMFCFVIPTVLPVVFFGESIVTAYFICALFRYCFTLHATWLVNSAAHMWGWRPYDRHINPAQNPIVSLLASGEGFHNYHHTFPQDYSTSELGWVFNTTTFVIDIIAFFGQVYDRKSIPKQYVERRRERTGDRSDMLKDKME